MSQEVRQTELQERTQQLLDGPLKHIRAAALAAALLPLASVAAAPASAQDVCAVGAERFAASSGTTRTTTAFRMRASPGLKAQRCPSPTATARDTLETETGPDGFYYLRCSRAARIR